MNCRFYCFWMASNMAWSHCYSVMIDASLNNHMIKLALLTEAKQECSTVTNAATHSDFLELLAK